jgi:dehydrogenase/reductase SDR family protein 7B
MEPVTTSMANSFFKDKVIWITGASSGIGEALVLEASSRGSKIVLSGRNIAALEQIAQKATQNGASKTWIYAFDTTNFTEIESIGKEVWKETGGVDFLINNAGISQRSTAAETQLQVDINIMNVNYFGPVAITKSILPLMIERGRGHITMMSSVVGYFGYYKRSAYSASKHAIHGFLDSVWAENAPDGIQTLIVTPGGVKTNISLHALDGSGNTFGQLDNLQTKGMSPEWVAKKVLTAISKNKRELLLANKERILVLLRKHFPKLFFVLIPKVRQ